MKKTQLLIALIATALLLCSCEKENEVIYYDNVIGEGWLATRNPFNPSIRFMKPHQQISLTQRDVALQGMFDWTIYERIDVITTDENGHFTCRFVKSIKVPYDRNGQEINFYQFHHIEGNCPLITFDKNIIKEAAKNGTFKEPTIIKLDTLYTYWEEN